MFFSSINVVVYSVCSHCTLKYKLAIYFICKSLIVYFHFFYILMYDLYDNYWK